MIKGTLPFPLKRAFFVAFVRVLFPFFMIPWN